MASSLERTYGVLRRSFAFGLDKLDLKIEAHASLFEFLYEDAVDQSDRGKVL